MSCPTHTLHTKNLAKQTWYSSDDPTPVTDAEMLCRIVKWGCKTLNSQQYIQAFECTVEFSHRNSNNATNVNASIV